MRPYQFEGRTYGIPWTSGMVGFWYNKELFARAGITVPPATWAELLNSVRKLKAAGITPIALGGKDKWPAHFYWTYLCMRVGGLDALARAAASKSFDNPDFVTAGARFKELIDLKPFHDDFQSAQYMTAEGQAAAVGNGKAALELMGQWAPASHAQWASNKRGIGDKLGFFPVSGGRRREGQRDRRAGRRQRLRLRHSTDPAHRRPLDGAAIERRLLEPVPGQAGPQSAGSD